MDDEQYAEFLSIVSLAGRTNQLLNGIKVPIDKEFDYEEKEKFTKKTLFGLYL